MNELKLTLAQLNPTVGDIGGNANKIRKVWRNNPDSDLIIFPELFLCGYPPEDLILKPSFLDAIQAEVDALISESKDHAPALLLSIPWRENTKTYSALIVIQAGTILHKQYKHHLPNYGIFDEKRIFEPGDLPQPFYFKGHTLGLMICEDAWFPNVAGHLKDQGAEMLIVSNGSPFSMRNIRDRMDIAKSRVEQTGLPLVYVNQVCGQDEIVFDGSSFVTNADGRHIFMAPSFREDVSTVTYPFSGKLDHGPLEEEELVYRAVTLGDRKSTL